MCASEPLRRLLALATCTLLALPAFGQQASREQELVRRLRQQLQQLQQQQQSQQDALARAQAEAGDAKAKAEAAEVELRKLRAAATGEQRAAREARDDAEAQRHQARELLAQLEKVQAAAEERALSLERMGAEREQLQQRLGARDAAYAELGDRHARQAEGLQACIAANRDLHALGTELLQRYANKGVAESLAEQEPFLQLKRVALENLLQGYEDKLDRLALRLEAARAPQR